MAYGYVYLIRCIANEKVYVGQTTQTLERRWYNHVGKAKNHKAGCSKLYAAIRKHGPDGFTRMIIGEAIDRPSLDALENHYLKFYDAVESGYNISTDARVAVISEAGKQKLREAVVGKPHCISNVERTPERQAKQIANMKANWERTGHKPIPPKKKAKLITFSGVVYEGFQALAEAFEIHKCLIADHIKKYHPELISQGREPIDFDALGFNPIPIRKFRRK